MSTPAESYSARFMWAFSPYSELIDPEGFTPELIAERERLRSFMNGRWGWGLVPPEEQKALDDYIASACKK